MVTINFNDQELEALYALIDASLKFNGVQMLAPANMVLQKIQEELSKQQEQNKKVK